MSGALESSITLEDVFVVVGAKRVPLAPELAGYLSLEIAEGAAQAAGEVDPRAVYIGEEGSVALVVRPRREPVTGDAEGSVRTILARLLDASGSQTQALAAVARRKPSLGLAGLVEELEAALIPVNRAAGRRALARLAREVKRVTLGVGRNASLSPNEPAREPPRRSSSPSHVSVDHGAHEPRPATREPSAPEPTVSALERAPRVEPPVAPASAPGAKRSPGAMPDASELPTVEVRKDQIAHALASRPRVDPRAEPSERPRPAAGSGVDEVDHLLASFAVSSRGDQVARNELKALVGLDPTPPPPGSEHAHEGPARGPHESDVESLLAIGDHSPAPAARAATPAPPPATALASPPTAISPRLANEPYEARARAPAATPPARGPSRSAPEDAPRGVPTAPSARKLAEMAPEVAQRGDKSMVVFALMVLVAGGVALWMLKPSLFGAPEAPASSSSAAPSTSAPSAAAIQAARCHSALVVTDAPPNAEVLLRVGQAPVDVERMPVGARLEFVATAEGFAPKRTVVPSGATWDTGQDGKPRYEVAVQLDHTRARAGGVDPWPPGEPGSEVGGKGSPGTVHLVATPRGAEVWLLAGLGPEARIDQLKCGGDVEVLVAGPTTLRKRLRVAEAAFVLMDGGPDREATVSAK